MKKLRIKVNGVEYDVDVEVLEDDEVEESPYGFPSMTSMPPQMPMAQAAAPAMAAPQANKAPTAPKGSGKNLLSPIAGTVVGIKVKAGDEVKADQTLIVIEAMKMNTNINATSAGKVKEIEVKVDDAVQQGQVLVTFE